MTDILFDSRTIILAHVGATWTMVGVIWVMQLVHYPLFAHVGAESYLTYQTLHMNRITWIVLPVMTIELITAGLIAAGYVPSISPLQAWSGIALLVLIWGTTALVHAPLHGQLTNGFVPDIHEWLVTSNWIRTIAWSLRGGLVLWMLTSLLKSP